MRHSTDLVARRSDGRPLTRPVPGVLLMLIALVCAGVVAVAVVHRMLVPGACAGAGLLVTGQAWLIDHPR